MSYTDSTKNRGKVCSRKMSSSCLLLDPRHVTDIIKMCLTPVIFASEIGYKWSLGSVTYTMST